MARKALRNSGSDDIFSSAVAQVSAGETVKRAKDAAKQVDQISNDLAKNSADRIRRMAVNSEESMSGFFGSLDKSAKASSKIIENDLAQAFEEAGNAAERAGHKFENAHHKAVSGKAKAQSGGTDSVVKQTSGLNKVIQESVGKLLAARGIQGELAASLEGIAGSLVEMAPPLLALGSIAGFILSIANAVFKLDDEQQNFAKNLGGNLSLVKDFTSQLDRVEGATHLYRDELDKMGMALHAAGVPIFENTESLGDYMIAMGDFHKIVGTSDEALASYTRSLIDSGKSAEEVHDSFANLYTIMLDYQMTTEQLNESLAEGNDLWREFGGIAGKSLDQVQASTTDVKGLFKAFNIDLKETKGLLAGVMGDPKTATRQAAFISQMLHKSGATAFNELMSGSAQGQQDVIESALNYVKKLPGLRLGEQLNANDASSNGAYRARFAAMQRLQRLGLSSREVNQVMLAASQNTGQSASDIMLNKQYAQQNKDLGSSGLDSAVGTFNNSIKGTMDHVGTSMEQLVNNIATNFLAPIPAIAAGVNGILNFITGGASSIKLPSLPSLPSIPNLGASAGHAASSAGAVLGESAGSLIDRVSQAQAILESGNGKYMPKGSNNPFGIKWSGHGPYVESMTSEHGAHGFYKTMAKFAKYPDMATAYHEHSKLLTNPNGPYKSTLPYLMSGNLPEYVKHMSKIYATDPAYADKLTKILEQLEKLNGTQQDAKKIHEADHNLNKQTAMSSGSAGFTNHQILKNNIA